jgi:hypothetical protein
MATGGPHTKGRPHNTAMPRTPLCVIGGYSAGLEMPPLRPNTMRVAK